MASLNTYLTFNGNCEEAFDFYKSVFGGEYPHVGRFKEMPPDPRFKLSEGDMEKIMHISLPIGKNSILMGSDTAAEWSSSFRVGNNFSISITTESKDEADRLFQELSINGKVTMPMNQTFWGSYFGILSDQFEINWMISFVKEA